VTDIKKRLGQIVNRERWKDGWNPFGGMIRMNKMDSLAGTDGKKMEKEKIMECTIPIPDDVVLQIKNQWPDIPRRALEDLALQAYRNGVITEYEVQKLLKISSRMELDAFLKESNAYIDYTEKDLQQDIKI
jgi:hypothetical protein